jgi:glycogen phosphorylase
MASTGTIDISSIGKPAIAPRAKRRHVRSLTGNHSFRSCERYRSDPPHFDTGDFPDLDEKGQEKWPKGDEQSWKAAMCDIHSGKFFSFLLTPMTLTESSP